MLSTLLSLLINSSCGDALLLRKSINCKSITFSVTNCSLLITELMKSVIAVSPMVSASLPFCTFDSDVYSFLTCQLSERILLDMQTFNMAYESLGPSVSVFGTSSVDLSCPLSKPHATLLVLKCWVISSADEHSLICLIFALSFIYSMIWYMISLYIFIFVAIHACVYFVQQCIKLNRL